MTENREKFERKPAWIRRRLPTGPEFEKVRARLKKGNLHTVCREAHCPNIWECFSCGTATFLIMGQSCTRNCRFCAISDTPPGPLDPREPERVAKAAEEMALRYVVITSVTRDDLPDGGAAHFAKTIFEVRKQLPVAGIEVLIPDFNGDSEALLTILDAHPDVLNHNVETVKRLYPTVRPQAVYTRSLELLNRVIGHPGRIPAKSGLMLGLGESSEEIRETLMDLRAAGCSIITLGQYLQPSKNHLSVDRYVSPEEFDTWKEEAMKMGFSEVASGPLIRSSYRAHELFEGNPDAK